MLDDFPDFLRPSSRDALRESRTAHAVRSAGRPRRVLYVEGPDVPPPADPGDGSTWTPDGWCWCHDEPVCPDAVARDRSW